MTLRHVGDPVAPQIAEGRSQKQAAPPHARLDTCRSVKRSPAPFLEGVEVRLQVIEVQRSRSCVRVVSTSMVNLVDFGMRRLASVLLGDEDLMFRVSGAEIRDVCCRSKSCRTGLAPEARLLGLGFGRAFNILAVRFFLKIWGAGFLAKGVPVVETLACC